MKVAIIKYNAGNVQSVLFALERIGVNAILSDNADEIQSADKIIFPGVGEASSAMNYLRNNNLDSLIVSLKQPTLGICLGMQLMCKYSDEGNTNCLGIFNSSVKKFDFERQQGNILKVPQIGWNTIYNLNSNLFKSIKENEYMYFVHSYYVEKSEDMIATTNYGIEYSSALQKNNFYAVQFHPEKSSDAGQQIMQNFIAL
ncbi:MAG: imidazole glycerol phosphate synthase subunit HisH [Bacteroidia bacterium]|nr:imidazole glycerol phosphate synthase subunit HisH [Bacteroidia bacterium]